MTEIPDQEQLNELLYVSGCVPDAERTAEALIEAARFPSLKLSVDQILHAAPEQWQELKAQAPELLMQLLEAVEGATVAERERRRWQRSYEMLTGQRKAVREIGEF